ncbi:hypothetical protein C8J56DRAFT_896208 [Mycena floridula]|nr:hypothetical protein C8J56DRAFT_896208 [Mycena floridula]
MFPIGGQLSLPLLQPEPVPPSLHQQADSMLDHPLCTPILAFTGLNESNEPGLQAQREMLCEYLLNNPQIFDNISRFSLEVPFSEQPSIEDIQMDLLEMSAAGFSVSAFNMQTGEKALNISVESVLENMDFEQDSQWHHDSLRYFVIEVQAHPKGTGRFPFDLGFTGEGRCITTIDKILDSKNSAYSLQFLKLPGELDHDAKDRIYVSSMLTPAGNLSLCHTDGMLGIWMHHIGGIKIWFEAEMTEKNWEIWKRSRHLSSQTNHLDMLQTLEKVWVFCIDKPCRWLMKPFTIHFVMSCTKAAHCGITFYLTSDLDEYVAQIQRSVEWIGELKLDKKKDEMVGLLVDDMMDYLLQFKKALGGKNWKDNKVWITQVTDFQVRVLDVQNGLPKNLTR